MPTHGLPDISEHLCDIILRSLARFKLSRGVKDESELEEEIYKWLLKDVFSIRGGLLALRPLLKRQVDFYVGKMIGRADIALANAVCIELKFVNSEDDLIRLRKQINFYKKAFRYVIAVCYNPRHIPVEEIRRKLGITRRVKRVKFISI